MKKLSVLFVFGVFLITGCGGSSSPSSSGSTTSSLTYTGSTAQAVVDSNNANDLAGNTYQAESSGFVTLGTNMESPGTNSLNSNRSGAPGYFRIATFLTDSVKENALPAGGSFHSQALQTVNDTIPGSCGGTIAFNLTVDDLTNKFDGTLTETNYCSYGAVGNGTVTFSGSYDLILNEIAQMTISTSSFAYTSGSDSFIFSGTMTATFRSSTGTIVMNFLVRDNATSKVYKLENFTISATDGVSFIDVSMSGRFFEPDYGYVDISTLTPFRISGTNLWPSSGIVVLTGKNSGAKLTTASTVLYQIDVDTDGDGAYETNLGTFGWSGI